MRLIDADALIDKTDDRYSLGEIGRRERDDIVNALEFAPTIDPEQHWILCSERLPEEDGGLYLVTDYAKSINRRGVHLSRCYMNKDYFWSNVLLGYKVIAWMPLPEAWRGDAE